MKTYSGLLHTRLYQWSEYYGVLPQNQFGFRKSHSTSQAISNLLRDIKDGLSTIGRYYVCFVDFRKAFDSVDRMVLLTKLLYLGVGDRMGRAIYSILKDNVIRILDGDQISGEITTDLGVPQGDKLSPLLFSLFLADLSSILSHTRCKTYFYADDLAIGATVLDEIQHAMRILEKYCYENYLTVSIDKTKVMKFRNGGPLDQGDHLWYENQQIEFTTNFC